MMKKRMAACIALAALMICLFLAPAFAEQTERNLMMGTSGLADYDSVFIGNHRQEDFRWHVIPYGIFMNDQTKLTLFSQYVISSFDSVGAGNNFMKTLPDNMFSAAERDAMPSLSSPDRWSIDRLYYENRSIAGIGTCYWTSDVEAWSSSYILDYYVDEYGGTEDKDDGDHTSIWHVRPVGNLTKENVLFTSKVEGGKISGSGTGNTLVSTAKQTTDEDIDTWRFTLKDQARSGFAITSAELSGNQVTVHYAGAQTGPNEYFSAIITDGGSNILYYGRIKQLGSAGDANGEVTITCPDDVTLGADRRLYVFNEQYNGGENDTQTVSDYASDLWPVNLVVSFDMLGHGSAPAPQSIFYGQKVVQPKATGNTDKVLDGWCKYPAGTQPWDFNSDVVTGDITLYAKWDEPVEFSAQAANGSDTESTTALTLTFDPAVTGLTEEDITLSGAAKGMLTGNSDGTYTLNISDISVLDRGHVNVAVAKRGYQFSPANLNVAVRNRAQYTEAAFSVEANGDDNNTTTALTLTFVPTVTGLTANDITLTGAKKGTLTNHNNGTYTLGISDMIGGDNAELTVAVAKSGFVFTPAKNTVTVRNHAALTQVAFDSVTANGWDGETTSLLTLTFDQDIAGLSAEDIILTGATKGTLTKVEGTTGQYTLSVLDVKVIDTDLVTVEVAKSGFAFSPASRKVGVRKYTPTPAQFVSVEADGDDNNATSKLTLTFDQDIEGLTVDDITLSASKKVSLQRIDKGKYELGVDIKVNDELTENVKVEKLGYTFTPDNHDVVVRNPNTFIISDAIRVTFAANGGDNEVTTELLLWFNLPVGGFTENHLELTGATKGQMEKINDRCYRLPITDITVEDRRNVHVRITGKKPYMFYEHDFDVAVRNRPPDEIEFQSVTANGSDQASTTELALQFGLDVPGLSAANIILTGADKGKLTKVEGETGQYILEISNISVQDQGSIHVALLKSGFAFLPVSSRDVTVRNHAEYTPVEFTSAQANTSPSGTTTELILRFNQNIDGLIAEDITLTGAAKGALQNGNAAGEYRLGISNLTVPDGGEVTVSVAKNGYVFSPATKKATVSNRTAFKLVEFFSANPADGSETSSTTRIVLTFAQDIDGLTADDITLSGAQKGKLTKRSHSTGIYDLEISNIKVPHNEFLSVTMAKEGFSFSPASHYVVVHDPVVYSLTVNDGKGGGNYQKDMFATISANAAPAGRSFKEWTGPDVDDLTFIAGSKNSSTAIILMPGHATTLTATYMDAPEIPSQRQSIMLGTDGLYQLDHIRFVNTWTILPEGVFGGFRAHPSDMIITLFSKDIRHRNNMYGCDIPAALEDLEEQFGSVELAAIPFVTGLDNYPDFKRFYVPTKNNIEELKDKEYGALAKHHDNFWLNDREFSSYLWWNAYVWGEQGSIEEVADGGRWDHGSIGLRAVSNINRDAVLFVSAPGIKQSGTTAAGAWIPVPMQSSPNEWRLTLQDVARSNFQIESVSLQEDSSSATINYAGAQTGANEYISALIMDADGNVQCYGQLKELQNRGDDDGSVRLFYPVGSGNNKITPSRDYRFYVFNEKYNGGEGDQGYTPDYSSKLIPVNVFVTFDRQDNGSAPDEQMLGYGSKAAKPADPSAAGKAFGGWFKDAACTQAWDFANDAVTKDTTLYAKWNDPIAFSSVTANGSDTESTTELTLTFAQDIEDLSASDITLIGADKGEITKAMDKTGKYILGISNITVADHETVTVTVAKDGFVFMPDSRTVSVRKCIPFTEVTAQTDKTGYFYGEVITVTGTAVAQGQETQKHNLLSFVKPAAQQVALYDADGNQLADSVKVENGTYRISYDTKAKEIVPAKDLILTVRFVGDANMANGIAQTNSFALHAMPAAPVLKGTASKPYDGTAEVASNHDLSISLPDAVDGDKVGADAAYAYEDASVGERKTIHASGIVLNGEDAVFYALTADTASNEGGMITKAELTGVTVPEDRTLDVYCADAAAVISRLPGTLTYAVGDVGTTELKISWQYDGYSSAPDAENTFVWEIDDDEKMACYELADGVAQSGRIRVKNASMLQVELTGEGLNHADGQYVYGEDIVVTLQAGGKTTVGMLKSVFSQPEAKQMALYKRVAGQADEQISQPVSEENGQYVLTVCTEDKLLAIGEHTIVAKYVGDANIVGTETVYTVAIARKPLGLSDVTVQSRYYRADDTTVDIIGAKLNGLEADADGTDDVQLAAGQKGILISDAVGEYAKVMLNAPALSGRDATWYTVEVAEHAANVSILAIPIGGLKTRAVVKPNYTDADIQATDLGRIQALDTVAEIDAQLRVNLAQRGAVLDTAVLYNVILEYRDVDGMWKHGNKEHFPEAGIEVVLPVVKDTTPATHVYTVAHMFTTNMRGSKAGDVEYPVPTIYQDAKGELMLKFTVNGLSPIMVAAIPIPSADVLPKTGDHSNIMLYAMLLSISVIGLAAAKKRRTE